MKWEGFLVLKRLFSLLIILECSGLAATQMPQKVEPGMRVPSLSLKSVGHGQIDLAELRGQPLLVSFISTAQESSLSRSQIVFLKSIFTQHRSAGVRVLLVDAPSVDSREVAGEDHLMNFSYDWALESIPLLQDTVEDSVAQRYGVRGLPTTFLINTGGLLADRWDGLATTAQLEFALQRCLRPVKADDCEGSEVLRAVFPGLPPARRLSEHIWVIEDGKPWTAGRPKTLRWVVLSAGGAGKLRLFVTERVTGAHDSRVLIEEVLDPLPESEAGPMTSSLAGSYTGVYLATTAATLLGKGCHEVEARIVDYVSGSILSEGQMSILLQ
jgi:peroxiredoxin